jgi:hypothetical protein
VKTRRFNRGREVARLREALTIKPSPRLYVVRALVKEGAIPVSPDRVSQDLKGRVGGFKSRTREIARFS